MFKLFFTSCKNHHKITLIRVTRHDVNTLNPNRPTNHAFEMRPSRNKANHNAHRINKPRKMTTPQKNKQNTFDSPKPRYWRKHEQQKKNMAINSKMKVPEYLWRRTKTTWRQKLWCYSITISTWWLIRKQLRGNNFCKRHRVDLTSTCNHRTSTKSHRTNWRCVYELESLTTSFAAIWDIKIHRTHILHHSKEQEQCSRVKTASLRADTTSLSNLRWVRRKQRVVVCGSFIHQKFQR